MGKVVHVGKVRAFIRTTPAFRAKDVELLVGDGRYASLLLHNMEKRGEAKRITKGWYSVTDDPVVGVFAFRPAYLGLQEALSLRNLWEQETNVVIVSASKVRPGVRDIMGSTAVVRRIKPEHFFGFDYIAYGDIFLPVSDAEKTLIDLVYFGDLPGKDVLESLMRDADRRKLREYLLRYTEGFRAKFDNALSDSGRSDGRPSASGRPQRGATPTGGASPCGPGDSSGLRPPVPPSDAGP